MISNRITRCLTIILAVTAGCLSISNPIVSANEIAMNSPAGLWKTIDDETGKEKSLVRISQNGEALEGVIEKLFRNPDEEQNPVCDKCKGEQYNQPIIGMKILWDMKKKGDVWTNGSILDPKKGSVYHCTIRLDDSGKVLKVRGYIGVSLIGRSQSWYRVDEPVQ